MTTAATGEAAVNSIHDLLKSFARSAADACFPETDSQGNPALSKFFIKNGRLPFVTDEIKPWAYRGWLIPYLQMCEAHPLVSPRYDYVLRTLDAGHLLDEPVPQISFVGEYEPATKPGIKMLNDLLDYVERASGTWNGMRDLCEWLSFALGVTPEPSKLDDKTQEHLYRNFNLEPLLLHPSDYLGQMLCETNHGKRNGFYPTPINICELMIQMVTADNPGDRRHEKTHDPCVGTGRMMLVASNYSMRLYGQDIDPLCCLITKINLALYAPWFYIPDSFFGDEPPGETETVIEPSKDEKPSQTANTAQMAVSEPEPETLFERLRRQKEKLDKTKTQKQKIYSTEIEQPDLFGFGDRKEEI